MPRQKLSIVLIMMMALWMTVTIHAQDNLLQNPGFNNSGNYVDQRPSGSAYAFAIAPGWSGWQTLSPSTESWMNIEPIAYPHTAGFKQEGDASQNIGRGDATWTAAVYQTIGGVAEGSTFRFNAWVFHDSEAGSGSQTRVGIGSNVGGNPLGSPITWSPWMTAIDSWQEVTVEATVPAGSITVFIYSTQSSPKPGNQNFYDDASLVLVGGDGAVNVGDGGETVDGTVAPPPPPTSTPQTFAPFVNVQPTAESGRITHTVQTGDTLAAIAVAYGVPSDEILALNNLTRDQARFLSVGQQLLISEGSGEEASATEEVAEATEEVSDSGEDSSASGFTAPTATEAPTEAPTKEPTPDATATPTEIPATPTDAPTAPVETAEDSDPLAIETGVCTLMFNDLNNNNIQEGGEDLLSGGQISVSDSAGSVLQDYITDGENEPFCFDELAPGTYTMNAIAPDGFGLNSSVRSVSVQAGQAFTVAFAAVEGLEVAVLPTVDTSGASDAAELIEEEPDPLNNLRNIAGIIVLGIAGAVLLGGIVVGVMIGRGR